MRPGGVQASEIERDMYAIVRTGGKQYRVERGQRLLIERLAVKEGAEVALEPLLYRSEEAVLDKAGLQQVKVTAKVIEHVRGQKLRVFKFKPKRGYRRRTGHRQELTRIEVTEIAAHKRKPAGARAGGSATPAGEAAAAPAKESAVKRAPRAQPSSKPKAKPVRAATSAPEAEPSSKPKAKPVRAAKSAPDTEAAPKPKAKPARAAKPRKDADGS